ncbi:hypothetical protein [Paenibacillus ginsengarvi]|uniref:Uncharacterized protein n=1 Tax=Paenibacillus ginsengarvi TaxID=400777 RepID=A0A3B0C4D5_9BACL|nr:hypothetical protein [Paenibacillus ginsengarvi]RKN79114.1 hypothetical protein D7M11_20740 [Paenibacillus ginsengarvi]
MLYTKLIAVAMLTDLLLSALVGLGVYGGFSIHPAGLFGEAVRTTTPATNAFQAAIPLWMPSIQDLKQPLSLLPEPAAVSYAWTVVFSLIAIGIQSYSRGVYLGGLRDVVLRRKPSRLADYGRHYFKRMLGWSFLQLLALIAGVLLAPLGPGPIAILFLVLFVYSFVPYLIVLYDHTLGYALKVGPSLFRAHFWSFAGFALLTMFLTGCISVLVTLANPYRYYVIMLLYSTAATLLIGEFMNRLHAKTAEYRLEANFQTETIPLHRVKTAGLTALVLLVPAAATWVALGYPAAAVDRALHPARTELPGISYSAGFSDALNASDSMYSTYTWNDGSFRLHISLPDLADGASVKEIRGTAKISWLVKKERVTSSGSHHTSWNEDVLQEQTILYRLVRTRSEDGSFYYTSRGGTAAVIELGSADKEPMRFEMTVSGDGKNIFLLKYPAQFDAEPVSRIAGNGRYWTPQASRINAGDFRSYWFSAHTSKEDVLEMLAAKNHYSSIGPKRPFIQLAAALQEADGTMVNKALQTIAANGAIVTAPDWNEKTWSDYLAGLYASSDWDGFIEHLSRAGAYNGYLPQQLKPPPANTKPASESYRITVPFPGKLVLLDYETDSDHHLTRLALTLPGE